MIWAAAIGLLVGTAIGVFLMCLCHVSADGGDRVPRPGLHPGLHWAHGVSGQDREVRVLVLAIALRRLLRAVQGYIETGDGFGELAGAMSNAAEVLDTPRAVREGDNSEDGSEPPYPYPIGSGILCLWKRVVFSVEFVSRCRPPIHEAGYQVQMWIGQAKFPVGELWCNAEDAWTWLDGLFNAEVTSRAARVL